MNVAAGYIGAVVSASVFAAVIVVVLTVVIAVLVKSKTRLQAEISRYKATYIAPTMPSDSVTLNTRQNIAYDTHTPTPGIQTNIAYSVHNPSMNTSSRN